MSLSSLTACGNQTTTTEPQSEQTETISTEPETETVPETSSLEDETTETEFIEETDTSSSETLSESAEITNSKWADINGAWDAVHQYTYYMRSHKVQMAQVVGVGYILMAREQETSHHMQFI